jgi:hypothetical protein
MQNPDRNSARREDDRFDLRLENDPRFWRQVEEARVSLRAGRGVRLEDVEIRRTDQSD